ncbi:MAG: hypothetical protein I8H98_12390 [Moraxellaceae bacterium]|nr:hypothetical protein [Moraxellaceae bacterium]MBH2029253.1 hypothetical protein [Moraxellaceae bacterium]
MSADLSSMKDSVIRSLCKEKIESLEHWLRRLIDDTLTPVYGDYFSHEDASGNRLIKNTLAQQVATRRAAEPLRYPRNIDAVLLEDAVDTICKPDLFKNHFFPAMCEAFPDGRDEARTFLKRLLVPRNNLAHANAISARQAEQIICYSNDIIESLKSYYRAMGMQETYDVPLILRVTDSFGNAFTRSQFQPCHDGGIMLMFLDQPQMHLRPGDTLTLELEVDPAYDPNSYSIMWTSTKPWQNAPATGAKVVIPVSNKQVGQQFEVQCRITTNRDWHRMHMGADDFLIMYYKVLPPITQA